MRASHPETAVGEHPCPQDTPVRRTPHPTNGSITEEVVVFEGLVDSNTWATTTKVKTAQEALTTVRWGVAQHLSSFEDGKMSQADARRAL